MEFGGLVWCLIKALLSDVLGKTGQLVLHAESSWYPADPKAVKSSHPMLYRLMRRARQIFLLSTEAVSFTYASAHVRVLLARDFASGHQPGDEEINGPSNLLCY